MPDVKTLNQNLTVRRGSIIVGPPSIAAGSLADVTLTITGIREEDLIVMNPPTDLNAFLDFCGCWISADDTVKIRLGNWDTIATNDTAKTWQYVWLDFAL